MKHFNFIRRRPSSYELERRSATSQSVCPDARALFQAKKQRAIEAGAKVLSALSADLEQGSRYRLNAYLDHLNSIFDTMEMVDCVTSLDREDTPPAPADEPDVSNYLISSYFLAECHAYLTSQPNNYERLRFVTGIRVSPKQRTLERMVQVALVNQSAISASADQQDLQKILIELDERWGHFLHGLFHSHPGKGAQATRPSSTDFETHERYERGGYPLVGAIFVKDGFVRFFSHHPFTVTLFGKGVEPIEEHIFAIRNLSYQAPPDCY